MEAPSKTDLINVELSEISTINVRLCRIVRREEYDGYGFNLNSRLDTAGQFVGLVEEGSPAEAAGLMEGDRILEVNGVDVTGESHSRVVQRILAEPCEARLLVADEGAAREASCGPPEDSDKESQEMSREASGGKSSPIPSSPKLDLNISAMEMRAKLAARKKVDVKKEATDIRQKHAIVDML